MAEKEELTRKKRCRNGHRTSAKRIMASVGETLMSVAEKSQLTPHIAKLKQQRSTLETKLKSLREQDEAILALVSVEDIELEIEQGDITREKIESVIIEVQMALEEYEKSSTTQLNIENNVITPVTPTQPTTSITGNNSETASNHGDNSIQADPSNFMNNYTKIPTVKLPKLNLRAFRGDPTSWATFWDTFESSIHNNPTLSSIDKFNYLSSLVEGTAADAIAGLTLTTLNYEEAIKILKKRFGNKQLAINKHMDILLNLEPVTSPHNLKGLRTLYDTVESHIRALKSLGVQAETYGNLLCSMLLNKLPQELCIIVSREIQGDVWELGHLLELIEKELEARERATANTNRETWPHYQTKKFSKPQPSISTLQTGGTSPTCTYCQQSHTSNSCTNVSNITARIDIIKRSGRCFLCLRKNHLSRDCNSKSRCHKCNGKHHISICTKNSSHNHAQKTPSDTELKQQQHEQTSESKISSDKPSRSNQSGNSGTKSLFTSTKTPILLQTAKATILPVSRNGKSGNVRVILDGGSQRSYITSRTQDLLSLPTERTETMSIKTFGSGEENLTTCDSVNFILESHTDKVQLSLSAFVVPTICEPLQYQLVSQSRHNYPHLHDLVLADDSMGELDSEVDILIGCDQYWDIVTGEIRKGTNGPTAINTNLGWVLSGPVENHSQQRLEASVNVSSTHVLQLETPPSQPMHHEDDQQLRRFWDLESLGISKEEKSVAEEFTSTIGFKAGRYHVELPWKEHHPLLPDNYEMSRKRLWSLLERLKRDPEVLKEYDAVIKDQLTKGVVEIVEKEDIGELGKVHYIPHHAVIRRDKETTKLRIVYDASAKTSGPSLNECLYTGPAMTHNIMDIILRFRSHKVALAGDIEKAFLMIAVSEADRNVLRFLWFDDVWSDQPKIIVLRFTRVVFGVSSSPFLLNATISHHIEQYRAQDPAFVEAFMRAVYVDDLNSGGNDDKSAYTLYKKSKLRLAEGGFNLRKFVTNSPELLTKIKSEENPLPRTNLEPNPQVDEPPNDCVNEDETYSKITLGTSNESSNEEHKVLGVAWNFVEDDLVFDLSHVTELASECSPTKRNIVRLSAKFYDPIGFMSPITVQFKMLFQELCGEKLNWDDEVPHDLKVKWDNLVNELKQMNRIRLSRCYFREVDDPVISCIVHGFGDASKAAYAAVTYLVMITTIGIRVKFLAAKTRVAPIERQTIPRLELLSCLILARLVKNVQTALRDEIKLDDPVCWSDSKVALFWITNGNKEWKQFVENRVSEIRNLLPTATWRHCPGRDNPADIPSRGIKPTELTSNELWSCGPEWLTDVETHSCQDEKEITPPKECLVEVRSTKSRTVNLIVNTTPQTLSNIINIENFGTLDRLVRVTAYVLRFVKILKAKTRKSDLDVEPSLTVNEIRESRELWIKEMQRKLPEKNQFEQWKAEFGLYTDEQDIWRCKGRLEKANLPQSAKHPILVDKEHYFASLIVYDSHRRVMHNGVKETLTDIRSQYWIVRGRQFVRKLIGRCSICRRFEGKPYQAPPPPPLPEFRVRETPPFTATGIDFLGPLYVRTHEKSEKVWVCLYTRCVTRAVHLDVVPTLTKEGFIRSFRRFTARRGVPSTIVSDNAGTFKAASREIKTMLRDPGIRRFFVGMNITWSFNLPKAPWWGGIFERLVKSTKRCLKKTVGGAQLTYEELLTVVAEVEMILNSRPISYVSTEDLQEPLTPSHLLTGRRLLSMPEQDIGNDILDPEFSLNDKDLSRRMKHLSTLMNHFWTRWRDEYLMELRNSHRGKNDNGKGTIRAGDIVVVHDESQPRACWRLGKVERLINGEDGNVRGAIVRISPKGKRPTTLKRSVRLLYPLEVRSDSEAEENRYGKNELDEAIGNEMNQVEVKRPRREAAKRGEERRRKWIEELNDS